MLTKRTVVSQIEITEAGIVQLRLAKQVVEDGVVLAQEYHRTAFEPGESVEDTMALVNKNLKSQGCELVDTGAVARVKRLTAEVHTPAVVAAYRQLREAHKATKAAESEHVAAAKANPNSQATQDAAGKIAEAQAAAVARYQELVETVRRGA